MTDASVRLTPIKVSLDHLLLDPNNPRFARSLNLPENIPDEAIASVQQKIEKQFVNERDADTQVDDDDSEVEERETRIGDLIRSMEEIGFVPIDRVVVRELAHSPGDFVVIEGNRRVRSAKYLSKLPKPVAPEERRRHEVIMGTLAELDVLRLDTAGLTPQQVHDQIGVILGLRHFGQVLPWGPLAKAVNIFHEYMHIEPTQSEFRLDNKRVTQVETRISQSRSNVMSALKTYIAYRQLQEAFPNGPPKASHFSLLQACVNNRKLAAAGFIEQDGNSFKISEAALNNLNKACEFESRDASSDGINILIDPKAVNSFAGLIADAASDPDSAIRSFAARLQEAVLAKERTLADAVDNLRSFKGDRAWTVSLDKLLRKVVEPGSPPSDENGNLAKERLLLNEFSPTGNDLMYLEEARKAFKNVRTILGI